MFYLNNTEKIDFMILMTLNNNVKLVDYNLINIIIENVSPYFLLFSFGSNWIGFEKSLLYFKTINIKSHELFI